MQKLKFSINGTKYEATVAEKEHNVAEVIGSAIGSEEITVRSIDIP